MALRALYWGEETNKDFVILIDGTQIAEERRDGQPSKAFVARAYPISVDLTRGQAKVRVRIATRGTDEQYYEVRMIDSEARLGEATDRVSGKGGTVGDNSVV